MPGAACTLLGAEAKVWSAAAVRRNPSSPCPVSGPTGPRRPSRRLPAPRPVWWRLPDVADAARGRHGRPDRGAQRHPVVGRGGPLGLQLLRLAGGPEPYGVGLGRGARPGGLRLRQRSGPTGIRVGSEPEGPRNRWARGGGARDETRPRPTRRRRSGSYQPFQWGVIAPIEADRRVLARIIRGGLDSDTSGVWKVAGVGLRWT